jgi:tol-pal system protein YbgF
MRLRLPGLLAVGLVLTGCELMVAPEDNPTNIKLQELDNRMTRVERVIDNDSLGTLLTQIQALQKDTQGLRAQLEELQHEVEQANDRQRQLYLDLDQRLTALQSSAGALAQDRSVLEGGTLAPGKLPVPGGTDRANYQASFELLKQGRYEEAARALQQFMVTYPNSEYADNAQYWLAETHYVTQDYKTALREFQVVIDRFPDSRKLPDALLKIGFCNYELQRWAAARKALAAVAQQYPETTAARLANQRLERMTEEGR